MVHPDYQRKGIGSALLRHGLEDLDMKTQTIDVYAAYFAHKLYAKFGWKAIGELEADLNDWMGNNVGFGRYKHVLMVREPADVSPSSSLPS